MPESGWWHRDDFCIRSCNEVPLFCYGTHANGEITFDLGSWRAPSRATPFLELSYCNGLLGSLSVSELRQKS